MDYKSVWSQQFLHLPHASGAAPTISVMIVWTISAIPSTNTKSPIIANKKDHPQAISKFLIKWEDRMKTSIRDTTIKILIVLMKITYGDTSKGKTNPVFNSMELH